MDRRLWLWIALVCFTLVGHAADAPQVEVFTPQGTVKGVRQVRVRFTQPMVPFGDPRLVAPFDIDCAEKGTERWADPRNWVFDFGRDLPAGIKCTFRLKPGIKTMSGDALIGTRDFSFSTGGPAIRESMPYEGSTIDENQIFVLGLDAPAVSDSILANVYCEAEGVPERIGVRIVGGDERRQLLEQRRDLVDRYVRAFLIFKRDGAVVPLDTRDLIKGSAKEKLLRAKPEESPLVLVQCKQRLPNDAKMRLVWGQGVRTVSGVATDQDQSRAYQVRPVFRAEFHCERVNAQSDCIPVLPLSLNFSAPIARAAASRIYMKGADGKIYRPTVGDARDDAWLNSVSFAGLFPEKQDFSIVLPTDLHDDAGRALDNASMFPLAVHTDEFPPLAKFSSRFGIIELNADAVLPVTLRNLEASVDTSVTVTARSENSSLAARMTESVKSLIPFASEAITGSMQRITDDPQAGIIGWLRRVHHANDAGQGMTSIFTDAKQEPTRFKLPKPNGAHAFEVVGIRLKGPGLYVAELASPKLGAALHGDARPYYVQTAALVTNLAAHLELGRESSLVWVTSLDKGQPVPGAQVSVRDCDGKVYWEGRTDDSGLAHIAQELPPVVQLPGCINNYDRQYFVTARTPGDFTFLLSGWSNGITPWRFQLPTASYGGPYIAHAVFDRSLLRAGDPVHMKYVFRRHTADGFALVPKANLPSKVVISHLGSNQNYEQPVSWNDDGTAEGAWIVPKDAKQGMYQVSLISAKRPGEKDYIPGQSVGTFRVEAFRVPTMKAILKPLQTPLVDAERAQLDVQLNYLSGGGAGNAQVKLRAMLQLQPVSFPDYEDFVFANGNVQEGKQAPSARPWYYQSYELSDEEGESGSTQNPQVKLLKTQNLVLDAAGGARVTIDKLPKVDVPRAIQTEIEYRDANGETLTASTRIALWPAKLIVGLKPDAWAVTKDQLKIHAVVVDLNGRPQAGVPVKLDLLQRVGYSHRKRLLGGFYAYEYASEVKRIGGGCEGKTDAKGLLICEMASPVSGNVIVRAQVADGAGHTSYANRDVWVAGGDEWWFRVDNSDRMDVLPERKRYEPGETATFQVRMPFREATALVSVEREGVIESFVTHLSGKAPVIRVPIKGTYAPNVYVSVLAVRGRVGDVQPTALVDLGKPAFRLGIAEINVGWRAHELKVNVTPAQTVYKVRQTARVHVQVRRADNGAAPASAEIALAAVDEGLLQLMPNESWDLLRAMMARRSIEVQTSTAQMQVVGKRHYGRKALTPGGGGGRQVSRELFDTLLSWKARVQLDANGEADVDVPLNDSLSSFRIVAVAQAGADRFGSGYARVRTTQDVMLLSGLPPLVREQDRYRAGVTVRNSADKPLTVTVNARYRVIEGQARAQQGPTSLAPIAVQLAAAEAREIGWDVVAPIDARKLQWEFDATVPGDTGDAMKISQSIIPAVRVRTFQATLAQLDRPFVSPVAIPADAIPGRGGVQLQLRARLGDELAAVKEYMAAYPYTCLEQLVSQAIALHDEKQWRAVMASLPSYLDGDGLAKYFPSMHLGSDALTSYLVIIADEAGWEIPDAARMRMLSGLTGFVQGRVIRYSSLPTVDLALRKMAALNALARANSGIDPNLLGSIEIAPNLWPTSAVLDWLDVLKRSDAIPDRDRRLDEVRQVIHSRLNFQGTTMTFSTERADALWWLMISADVNANHLLASVVDDPQWREDMGRVVRGTVGRQHKGRWSTTVANAWGTIALEKFSRAFESEPVAGETTATLAGAKKALAWDGKASGGTLLFGWPPHTAEIDVAHQGGGKPWLTVQSLAAIPLKAPFSSGYKIVRKVAPVQQKSAGTWSRGDVYRVRLELEAQSDMTWVVVRDPIPSGASILGTGLGGDSQILASGERRQGWVWPAFEERTQDSFRAYYEFVPKGKWVVEYTVRLNNSGRFRLPETRVEAMYSPEMFGEIPNAGMDVGE